MKVSYNFDSVYETFATQHEVFDEVRPLIGEVMRGYEATVFAYGQTGTGKTHTMEGDITSDEMKGIIPRAVEAIFQRLGDEKVYTASKVSAQYLEIYNEELCDLLLEGPAVATGTSTFGKTEAANEPAKLRVVEDTGSGKTTGPPRDPNHRHPDPLAT